MVFHFWALRFINIIFISRRDNSIYESILDACGTLPASFDIRGSFCVRLSWAQFNLWSQRMGTNGVNREEETRLMPQFSLPDELYPIGYIFASPLDNGSLWFISCWLLARGCLEIRALFSVFGLKVAAMLLPCYGLSIFPCTTFV